MTSKTVSNLASPITSMVEYTVGVDKVLSVTVSVTAHPVQSAKWKEGSLWVRGLGKPRAGVLEALVEFGREVVKMGPTIQGLDEQALEERVVHLAQNYGTLTPPGFPIVDPIPSIEAKQGEWKVFYPYQRVWGEWSWAEDWVNTGETTDNWVDAAVTVLAWAEVMGNLDGLRDLGEIDLDEETLVHLILKEFLLLRVEEKEKEKLEEAVKKALNPTPPPPEYLSRIGVTPKADKTLIPSPGPSAILAREARRIAGVIVGEKQPRVAMRSFLAAWGLKGVYLTPTPGFGWVGKVRGLAGVFHLALLELAREGVRFCQHCGRMLHGRVDARFCSASCRASYHKKAKRI